MPFIVDWSGGGKKRLIRAAAFFCVILLSVWGMIVFETLTKGIYGKGDAGWRSHAILIWLFLFSLFTCMREFYLFIKESHKSRKGNK
jgi:hypothetical protein